MPNISHTALNSIGAAPGNTRSPTEGVVIKRLDGGVVKLVTGVRRLYAQLEVSGAARVVLPTHEVMIVKVINDELQEVEE